MLWAGGEIQRFGLQGTLQELVDASGLYFTTTSLGKTVLDENQDQFIGTYAGPASPALTWAVMDDAADCVVALGTIVTDDYLNIMHSSFGEMIEVTDEEARVGYEYYHRVTLQDFLSGLLGRFREDERFPRKYDLPKAEMPSVPDAEAGDGLSYNNFYAELNAFLKNEELLDDIALVLGESTSLYVFGNLFGLPRGSFVAQAAWGSLGHETGCALGVALGSGKRPWVVAGDGGFRMVCQELSSLAYRKCNAVVFVISNDAYAIEQAFVDIEAFTPNGQFAPFDVLPPWNYIPLAQAFGARGYRVDTVAQLRATLAEVKSLEDVPALVEVVIPQKDLAPQLKRLAETPPDSRKYRP